MTRAEKGDVRNYRDGDVVVFNQDLVNYRVGKDDILTVTGIERDSVVLEHPDGTARRIRPAGGVRYRLEVYETREIEIRAGDRIRWTRNDKARSLINGEKAEVVEIARDRVRLGLADGRTVSLRAGDPQLRHIDHAWSSTVHGAQGSTADRVIAVLDSSQRALTDQSTFYVEISRARDGAEILTDNREQLVEVLTADTGERPTAAEAVVEGIAPGDAGPAAPVPEKAPAWTALGELREEWRALEAAARRAATVLFLVDGYGALVERARELSVTPDLAAGAREFAKGLLAYDRACREEGKAAEEFHGLIAEHAERRRALDAAAADRAVASLEDYGAWRERADRLAANGPAVLAHPATVSADAAGETAGRIERRLDRLSALLAPRRLRACLPRPCGTRSRRGRQRRTRSRSMSRPRRPSRAGAGALRTAPPAGLAADRRRRNRRASGDLRGPLRGHRRAPGQHRQTAGGAPGAGGGDRPRSPLDAGCPCRLAAAVRGCRSGMAGDAGRSRNMEAPSGCAEGRGGGDRDGGGPVQDAAGLRRGVGVAVGVAQGRPGRGREARVPAVRRGGLGRPCRPGACARRRSGRSRRGGAGGAAGARRGRPLPRGAEGDRGVPRQRGAARRVLGDAAGGGGADRRWGRSGRSDRSPPLPPAHEAGAGAAEEWTGDPGRRGALRAPSRQSSRGSRNRTAGAPAT